MADAKYKLRYLPLFYEDCIISRTEIICYKTELGKNSDRVVMLTIKGYGKNQIHTPFSL